MKINDVNKYIIGQSNIIDELKRILTDIVKRGANHNVIIIGGSGMGKSHLLKIIANVIGVRNCIGYNSNNMDSIDEDKRIHIIDECHLLNTTEILYPFMDDPNYSFFLATNEYGLVKEPLFNRCISIILEPYTIDDLSILAKIKLKKEGIYLINDELYKSIASVSRDSPRRLIEITRRLSLIFKDQGVPRTLDDLDFLLMSIGVDSKTGLTNWDKKYLDFLSSIGVASLSTIAYSTGIDKGFIIKYIEPFLLKNGYIKITSRGRICL